MKPRIRLGRFAEGLTTAKTIIPNWYYQYYSTDTISICTFVITYNTCTICRMVYKFDVLNKKKYIEFINKYIQPNIPFFGSILNFFRPIDICLSLLECLQSS